MGKSWMAGKGGLWWWVVRANQGGHAGAVLHQDPGELMGNTGRTDIITFGMAHFHEGKTRPPDETGGMETE